MRSRVASLAVAVLVVLVSLVLPGTATARPLSPTRVGGWGSAPTSVHAGGVYSASVTVSGGARAVHLQRHVDTSWRTVSVARSDARGRATLTWAVPASVGDLRLRVQVPGTSAQDAAVTAARRVSVLAPVARSVLGRVLTLVNTARAHARSCGAQRYPAVPPLRRNARLDDAADRFAHLMAGRDFFAHSSPDGSGPGERISATGYRWTSYGENIAAGYSTPAAVVEGWLDSPGHCANLMGRFTEIGLGHAVDPDSTYGTYWVQDFATPR